MPSFFCPNKTYIVWDSAEPLKNKIIISKLFYFVKICDSINQI